MVTQIRRAINVRDQEQVREFVRKRLASVGLRQASEDLNVRGERRPNRDELRLPLEPISESTRVSNDQRNGPKPVRACVRDDPVKNRQRRRAELVISRHCILTTRLATLVAVNGDKATEAARRGTSVVAAVALAAIGDEVPTRNLARANRANRHGHPNGGDNVGGSRIGGGGAAPDVGDPG